MKIKIRLEKKSLRYLVACCVTILYERKHFIQDPLNEATLQDQADYENMEYITLLMMDKFSSPLKRPALSFNANYFLSLKKIVNHSRIEFDEYYQIVLNEFFTQCNYQIALQHMNQSLLFSVTVME